MKKNILSKWLKKLRKYDDEVTEQEILKTVIYATLLVSENNKETENQSPIPFKIIDQLIVNQVEEIINSYIGLQ